MESDFSTTSNEVLFLCGSFLFHILMNRWSQLLLKVQLFIFSITYNLS